MRPPKKFAAATSAALSILFVVVYGACNWITAHRGDVGTWYYGWERRIPFVPVMIVPYMSIDLFFIAAPFLCQTWEELRAFIRRITFAILVSGAFFLAFPLQFGMSVPQPQGWTGALFTALHGFDRPTNLFPSLHIVLRTILAHHYSRHSKGLVRALNSAWFSLIGFSTILTWQHHIVDVVGGFGLAGLCFYLFRENTSRARAIPNFRVGLYYALGALAAAVAASAWPALRRHSFVAVNFDGSDDNGIRGLGSVLLSENRRPVAMGDAVIFRALSHWTALVPLALSTPVRRLE